MFKKFDTMRFTFSRRNLIVHILTVVISIVLIAVGNRIATRGAPIFSDYTGQLTIQAKVVGILDTTIEETLLGDDLMVTTTTIFEADMLEGENKGMRIRAMHVDDPFTPYRLRPVEAGDRVFLQYSPEEGSEIRWLLQEYNRTDTLAVFGGLIVLALLIFGRRKGFSTLISLTFTCLSIFMVFIPSILSGQNIYVYSLAVGIYIIVMTILLINGIDQKSICSGIGCISGFLASGLLVVIMDSFLQLTGMVDEDSVYLIYLNPDNPIDLKAIVFAAIIIGAVGAVMDVAISMSSSLYEVYQSDPFQSAKDLMRSGMNIGRDIIGTMSNTLLLAYIGSSLSLVVLLVAYNNSLIVLLNKEMIVVEILQSLVGIAGLLLVIPLTSLACSVIFTRQKYRD